MDGAKMRLDAALVERGIVSGRDAAKALIADGEVYVDGKIATKPSATVAETALLEVRSEARRYVSRGGLKLEHALNAFGVDPTGFVCLDCGASTGGFTDCLLKHGAAKVYAIDVGTNQLAESLRNDARVVSREGVNAREIPRSLFDEPPQLATVDVSFISLALVLPAIRGVLAENGEVIALIKPQFEAGRGNIGKRGIVKDAKTHVAVLNDIIAVAQSLGFAVCDLTHSPIRIKDGNIEFLAYLSIEKNVAEIDVRRIVETSHKEL